MTDRVTFSDVVERWRKSDPKHIHPTREHVSEQAYWDSGRQQAEFVLDLLPEGGTVLDFGCGDGRIAIPLAMLGFEVVAVDAAPEMIERLWENVAEADVEMSSTVSDGLDGMHGQGPVDAINARAVLIHHSHTDVEALVLALSRVLKPGGFFIADWPVGEHHERVDWIDVTTWEYDHRQQVAEAAGLQLVSEGEPRVRPSVWRKQR